MSTPPTTITIAIVRFTGDVQEKENVDDDICALTSTNYDILLLNHHDGVQMPTCSVREYTQETARRRALQTCRSLIGAYRTPVARAILLPKSNIVCVPVLNNCHSTMMTKDADLAPMHPSAQFINLAKLEQLLSTFAPTSAGRMDVESEYALNTLTQWLQAGVRVRASRRRFLKQLFMRRPITTRLSVCVHNPARLGELRGCINYKSSTATKSHISTVVDNDDPSHLDGEVQTANKAGVKLISLDKCVKLVMNPAYQVVPVATQSAPVRYFCRDRTGGYASDNEPTTQPVDGSPSTYLSSTTNSSGTHTSDEASSWSDTYRLHYYANSGDVQGLQAQLRAGFNPNQADRYSWTPLHYAAWYNHLDCVGALVTYGDGCDVNARTKNGSTPMHFAARTGNYNVVQLLLSHAHIDIRAKDAEGKTPLAVCESVPKEGWQACAAILRAALTQEEHPKIQIDMMDGSNCMIPMINGADTTAGQLHEQMCNALMLPHPCGRLFKLWLCSENLELQLKDEHKPRAHMEKWSRQLRKFADTNVAGRRGVEEPRLVFRRDTRTTVDEEREFVQHSSAAHTLLYHEAVNNYLAGLYPCSRDDVILLGALILQILHGKYTSSKDDAEFLANERTRAKIIPAPKLAMAEEKLIKQIIKEHKKMRDHASHSLHGLQANFLTFCWRLVVYGATFFRADMFVMNASSTGARPTEALEVLAGVNDIGLHLINARTSQLMKSYRADSLNFVYEQDKPYIQLTANGDDHQRQQFRLRTMKAVHIANLLKQTKR